jgi:hypothetical protein
MPAITAADRAVATVQATDSNDWQVVSTPVGFLGFTSADFAQNDKVAGFLLHENGEDFEVYDTEDNDDSTLLEISNISGTVTIARPATPFKSSNSGDRINAGEGSHTLVCGFSAGSANRIFRETNPTWKTFTGGDATPSVAKYRLFKTSGNTAITAFDDAKGGQLFWVYRGDQDIVITHNANIVCQGGTSITLTVGNPSAVFIYDGTVARHVAGGKSSPVISVADYGAVSGGLGAALDTAYQAAVDALPATGGDIIVPAGTYSNLTPTNVSLGTKVVNWRADGATLPADMPGVVIKTHDVTEAETYQQSNRTAGVHYHYDAGDIAPPVGKRQYVHHVTAFLDDTADADEREFRAYSFTLETDTTNSNSDIRGMKGRVAATGGAANLRAIYGVADSSNGHTGLLTGLIGTCIRADGQTNEIAAVRGHLQPGTAPNGAIAFEAAGNGASRDASFGFRVRGGSGAALNCVTACFYGHGGGGGAIFRGDRSGTDTTTVFNVGPNGETVATVSETSGSAAIESILGIGNSSGTHNGAVTGVKGTVTRGEGQTNEVVGVAATIDPGTLSNGAIAYDAAGAGAAYTISIGYRVRGGSTALNCATANFYGHGGGGGDIIRGDVSAADTTAVFRATADGQVLAKSFISGEVTIADDAVYSFTPHDTNGIMIFMTRDTNQAYGMIWFRASGTNLVGEMTVGPIVDTNSEVTPTGTTGTDGNILITADSGYIHIENRTGASRTFNWMMVQRLA